MFYTFYHPGAQGKTTSVAPICPKPTKTNLLPSSFRTRSETDRIKRKTRLNAAWFHPTRCHRYSGGTGSIPIFAI